MRGTRDCKPPRSRRPALAAGLALAAFTAMGAAPHAEDVGGLASQYAAQVAALLPLLDAPAEPELLSAALVDVRRAVAEIDQVVASTMPDGPGILDAGGVRGSAATAHLHLAAFETRTRDFEGARRDIERARHLLGARADTFRVPWAARQDTEPGKAPITHYEMRTLAEFEALLRLFWSEARPIAFDLSAVDAKELASVVLSEAPGSPTRESDRPLVERGAALLRESVSSGKRSFSIPLPPGIYRFGAGPGSGIDGSFLVSEASEPDPVVVGAQRFALRLTIAGRTHTPRFFMNGVEVRDLSSMPYGYYRVDADREFIKDAPALIRFVPGPGLNNKSRSVWTLYVPAGEMTELRFGAAPLGSRLRD